VSTYIYLAFFQILYLIFCMKLLLFNILISLLFARNITEQQIETIYKICNDNNILQSELNIFLEQYHVDTIIYLSEKQAYDIINKLVNKTNLTKTVYDPMTGEILIEKSQDKKILNLEKKWHYLIGFGPSLSNNIRQTKNIDDNSNEAISFGLYKNYTPNTFSGFNLNGKVQSNGNEIDLTYHILSLSYITFIKNELQDYFITINLGPAKSSYNNQLTKKKSTQNGYSFMFGVGIPVFFKERILTFGVEYTRLSLKNKPDDYNFSKKNFFISLKACLLF